MGVGPVAACSSCSKPLPSEKIEGSAQVVKRETRVPQHRKTEAIESQYTLDTGKAGVISVGSMGTVFEAHHKKDKTLRAVKQIQKRGAAAEAWQQEVELLKTVDHPHICKLYETWEDNNNMYLVMELCRGGDLLHVVQRPDKLPELAMAVLVRQMVSAASYIHGKSVVHGDLRPESWLLSEPVAHTMARILDINLKMVDFGILAKQAQIKRANGKPSTPPGHRNSLRSVVCRAPEQLCVVAQVNPPPKVDVWAVGVLAYLLLGGAAPFAKDEDVRAARLAFEPQAVWSKVSSAARMFVTSAVQAEPQQRSEALDLLSSAWMAKGKAALDQQFERMACPSAASQPDSRWGAKARASDHQAALPSAAYVASSFRKMSGLNALEKVAATAAAHRLPPGKTASLSKFFEHLDRNGDGRLSTEEIRVGLPGELMDEELQWVLRGIDTDGNGHIDYTEFIAATYEFDKTMQEDILHSVFRIFDADGSGVASHDEIKAALVSSDNEKNMEDFFDGKTLDQILLEIDSDGNGEMNFAEFKALLRHES